MSVDELGRIDCAPLAHAAARELMVLIEAHGLTPETGNRLAMRAIAHVTGWRSNSPIDHADFIDRLKIQPADVVFKMFGLFGYLEHGLRFVSSDGTEAVDRTGALQLIDRLATGEMLRSQEIAMRVIARLYYMAGSIEGERAAAIDGDHELERLGQNIRELLS